MKKYVYSLLFLTALTSQLKGAYLDQGLRGIALTQLSNYSEQLNNKQFEFAKSFIVRFLSEHPLNIVIQIMADDKHSPLISAVRANQVDIVERIVDHDKFNQIPREQQTEFLREALVLANELNHEVVKERLQRLIAVDEEQNEDEA